MKHFDKVFNSDYKTIVIHPSLIISFAKFAGLLLTRSPDAITLNDRLLGVFDNRVNKVFVLIDREADPNDVVYLYEEVTSIQDYERLTFFGYY